MNWDNLEGITPQAYNAAFMQKLSSDASDVRMTGDNFVRDRLREDMVFNSIIKQTTVTPDRLQVSENSDTMVEVINLDANAAAAIVDFRGATRSQIVRAPRVFMGFHMIKSDEFEVTEQELLAYPFPIMRLVYDYSIKAVGDIHDLYMIQNCERAVAYVDANNAYKSVFGGGSVVGVDADGSALTTDVLNPFNTMSLTRAKQLMSNRIKPAKLLMTLFDHNTVDSLSVAEQGDVLRSETFISGYRQSTITGLEKVITTKNDVFRPGNIWLFADESMLGKNRVLDYGGGAYKLFIDRRSNVLTWHVYANFGALIANVGSVVKLKMYDSTFEATAGASGTDADGYDRVPSDIDATAISEEELFRNRNLAEAGGRFPVVRQF